MSPFPPDDPVANRLNQLFGGEFDHRARHGLEAIQKALAALDRPQDRLPCVVHIAGTNGKGSTAAFLCAIAAAAGLRAHAFTQPHLIFTRERVTLAGTRATDQTLLQALDAVARHTQGLSHFEAQTAAALWLFARTPADLAIIEVGCGGRDDATNVIPAPAVCAITPIDVDHVAMLGPTVSDIATHKAGIIKPGAQVFSARQHPDAEAVLEARAHAVGTALTLEGRDWQAWKERDSLIVQTADSMLEFPAPKLAGTHQVANAGLAILAARALGLRENACAVGVAQARHPGRLQPIKHGPLSEIANANGCQLVVDGGHNPHASSAIAAWLDDRGHRRCAAIIGMLADKDAGSFLAPLVPRLQGLVAVPVRGPRAGKAPQALAEAATALGLINPSCAQSLNAAMCTSAVCAGPGGIVLITGSIALAGEALASVPEP